MADIYKGTTCIVYHKTRKDGMTLFWQSVPKFSIINISKFKGAYSWTKICFINMPNTSNKIVAKKENYSVQKLTDAY